ncbi:adenylate kinase family enzyme [Pseudomonas sp. PvR086]
MKRLLLLSGPIASGKTSVSASLQERYGFVPISSGSFLRAKLAAQNEPIDRRNLQELGDSLDRVTDFSWLIESVASPAIEARPDAHNWLLDAVRKPQQVVLFKLRFGNVVKHVHIVAPEFVLEQRYAARGLSHLEDYQASVLHPNEQTARLLAGFADKILDTEEYTPVEIADQIMGIWEK